MSIYLKKYKSRVGNAKISLEQAVPISQICSKLNEGTAKRVKDASGNNSSLYFWDFGKRASEHIKIGDIIIIQTEDELFWGNAITHLSDKKGEIGDSIGWSRQFETPWVNPIGFDKIQKSYVDVRINSELKKALLGGRELVKNFYAIRADFDINVLSKNIDCTDSEIKNIKTPPSVERVNDAKTIVQVNNRANLIKILASFILGLILGAILF